METNRIQKIAYGILNILAEEYYDLSVSIEQAIACISGIYSIDTTYSEIFEAIDFFNEYVRDCQRKYLPDDVNFEVLVIKKEGIIYDKSDFYAYQAGWRPDYSDPNKRKIFTEEPSILIGWIDDLKNIIDDEEFTDKYLPISNYDGSYDITTDISTDDIIGYEDDDSYEGEDDDSYEDKTYHNDKEGSYILNEDYSFLDDEDFNYDENDPMEIRRDAWGNLYTVGGLMWERAMRKRDEDDY
jgi:hypothetical protein